MRGSLQFSATMNDAFTSACVLLQPYWSAEQSPVVDNVLLVLFWFYCELEVGQYSWAFFNCTIKLACHLLVFLNCTHDFSSQSRSTLIFFLQKQHALNCICHFCSFFSAALVFSWNWRLSSSLLFMLSKCCVVWKCWVYDICWISTMVIIIMRVSGDPTANISTERNISPINVPVSPMPLSLLILMFQCSIFPFMSIPESVIHMDTCPLAQLITANQDAPP